MPVQGGSSTAEGHWIVAIDELERKKEAWRLFMPLWAAGGRGGSILHSPPRRPEKLNTSVTKPFIALPGREKGKAGDHSPAFVKRT